MNTQETIETIRNSHSKLSKELNGVIACIVSTRVSARKSHLGVQYWTPEEIAAGTPRTNLDRTVSTFIEKL